MWIRDSPHSPVRAPNGSAALQSAQLWELTQDALGTILQAVKAGLGVLEKGQQHILLGILEEKHLALPGAGFQLQPGADALPLLGGSPVSYTHLSIIRPEWR